MYIFSKKNKKKILGAIYRQKAISNLRNNISPVNEYLQISTQRLKKGDTIKPHIHKKNIRITKSTQEIWLVLNGKISIKIIDIDKNVIHRFILNKGDMYILFRGGHTLNVLSNNAEFYEIKNGPYKKNFKDIEYIK